MQLRRSTQSKGKKHQDIMIPSGKGPMGECISHAGALKSLRVTNAIEEGPTIKGKESSTSLGSKGGMSPAAVSCNGHPFSSMVLLFRFPSLRVK